MSNKNKNKRDSVRMREGEVDQKWVYVKDKSKKEITKKQENKIKFPVNLFYFVYLERCNDFPLYVK